MSGKESVIHLNQVNLAYHDRMVFDGITHSFPDKAVTTVIGASGTGKTTLLRTINRLNDSVEGFRITGNVCVLGQDIYQKGVDVCQLRRTVGMVFQKPCTFPKSIYENVIFGLSHFEPGLKKEFPELAEKVLREVFLWEEVKDRLHRPAKPLSHGQQQRLSLARSLLIQPQIILMDEPTSSLDPKSSKAIEELIFNLKQKRTIILVTHNMEQAKRISDEVVFVCDGQFCEAGPAEELFAEPRCPETQEYLRQGD